MIFLYVIKKHSIINFNPLVKPLIRWILLISFKSGLKNFI